MSVASLTDVFRVVEVADEIESFVNVLLHNAVERIPWKGHEERMKDVMAYFLQSANVGGMKSCGDKKSTTVRQGVGITIDGQRMSFDTKEAGNYALNTLMLNMFGLFQARYKVLDHKRNLIKTNSPAPEATDSLKEGSSRPAQRHKPETGLEGSGLHLPQVEGTSEPPTPAVAATARLLNTHTETFRIFRTILKTKRTWPENEVLRPPNAQPEAESTRQVGQSTDGKTGVVSARDALTQLLTAAKLVLAYKPPRAPPRQRVPRRVGAMSHGMGLSDELMNAATPGSSTG